MYEPYKKFFLDIIREKWTFSGWSDFRYQKVPEISVKLVEGSQLFSELFSGSPKGWEERGFQRFV